MQWHRCRSIAYPKMRWNSLYTILSLARVRSFVRSLSLSLSLVLLTLFRFPFSLPLSPIWSAFYRMTTMIMVMRCDVISQLYIPNNITHILRACLHTKHREPKIVNSHHTHTHTEIFYSVSFRALLLHVRFFYLFIFFLCKLDSVFRYVASWSTRFAVAGASFFFLSSSFFFFLFEMRRNSVTFPIRIMVLVIYGCVYI